MLKRLMRRPAVQAALAALVGRYLAFALSTTRWTLQGWEHLDPFIGGGPLIAAFWHERLPLMTALRLRARQDGICTRMVVLVSRHNDGRFIGDIMGRFHLDVVHGSTASKGQNRGGAAGLRALLERVAGGQSVAITPDGPRGPRRKAAPGMVQLAALTGAPVLPCAAQTSRKIVLNTWDRMVLPLPFGRGVLVCLPLIAVPRNDFAGSLPAIEAAITEATDRADALCR
jgi:lysophospholipid acyltransferase (LPLAT)-like uncharacterized protein